MPDQAESLRQLVLRTTPGAPETGRSALVLVFCAQESVDAGALGLQIALAWKRRSGAAALVQLCRRRLPWLTPQQLEARATLQDVSRGQRILREVWLTGPCGLSVIGDDLDEIVLSPSDLLVHQMRESARRQPVIVDTQALDDLLVLLPIADYCLFVGRPDSTSMTATYRAIKMASGCIHRARCGLTLSQVADAKVAEPMQARVVMTCDRCLNLALDPLDLVSDDHDLAADGVRDLATLSVDHSTPYQRCIERIVEHLDLAVQRQRGHALAEWTA